MLRTKVLLPHISHPTPSVFVQVGDDGWSEGFEGAVAVSGSVAVVRRGSWRHMLQRKGGGCSNCYIIIYMRIERKNIVRGANKRVNLVLNAGCM